MLLADVVVITKAALPLIGTGRRSDDPKTDEDEA